MSRQLSASVDLDEPGSAFFTAKGTKIMKNFADLFSCTACTSWYVLLSYEISTGVPQNIKQRPCHIERAE